MTSLSGNSLPPIGGSGGSASALTDAAIAALAGRGLISEVAAGKRQLALASAFTKYIYPSGGDDTAQIKSAFDDLTVKWVEFPKGFTFKLSQAGVLNRNPLRTGVTAYGAIFDCGAIPQPAMLPAGDQINFATAMPILGTGASAVRNGDGTVTFSGGKCSYPVTMYPRQQATYAATVASGTLKLQRDIALDACKSPDGTVTYVPAGLPGENSDAVIATGVTTSFSTSSTATRTGIPQPYLLTVDASAGPVTLSALSCSMPAATQRILPVISHNAGSAPPLAAFSGSSLTGLTDWYANPWLGGKFIGKIDPTQVYPYIQTPGVACFDFVSTDKTAVRSILANIVDVEITGFSIGEIFKDNSFADGHRGCHLTYNGTQWVLGGRFNSGEIFRAEGCFFNNSNVFLDGGGGGQVDLISSHVDYHSSDIIFNYADVRVIGGWWETSSPGRTAPFSLQWIQSFNGLISFRDCNIYKTHTSIVASNQYLVEIEENNTGQFPTVLTFDNVRTRNLQASIGLNRPAQEGFNRQATILMNGKIITELPDGSTYTGTAEQPRVAGVGEYALEPRRADLVLAGSTTTLTEKIPNNGSAVRKITLGANTAITIAPPTGFPNRSADAGQAGRGGEVRALKLVIVGNGFTPSFTNTITWASGTAPTFGTGTTLVTISTIDFGVTWMGALGIL